MRRRDIYVVIGVQNDKIVTVRLMENLKSTERQENGSG
jgi:hypothetical protein